MPYILFDDTHMSDDRAVCPGCQEVQRGSWEWTVDGDYECERGCGCVFSVVMDMTRHFETKRITKAT